MAAKEATHLLEYGPQIKIEPGNHLELIRITKAMAKVAIVLCEKNTILVINIRTPVMGHNSLNLGRISIFFFSICAYSNSLSYATNHTSVAQTV